MQDPYIASIIVFLIGLSGMILRSGNLVLFVLSSELILISASLLCVYTCRKISDPEGWIFALLLLVVAAVETAIGLGLYINYNSREKKK
jgi:NADH-quinone oxidoreductase subunit K